MREAELQFIEYKALAISKNKEPYKLFLEVAYDLETMLALPLPDKKLGQTLARTLFATGITAMESYLSDTFINRVLSHDHLLQLCVETDPDLSHRKLELGDIYQRHRGLKSEVQSYLSEVVFHNLAKIRLMYKSVLAVDFPPDLSEVFRAIQTRHDIVHRSGKSKSGTTWQVSPEDVRALIKTLKNFVSHIETQLIDA